MGAYAQFHSAWAVRDDYVWGLYAVPKRPTPHFRCCGLNALYEAQSLMCVACGDDVYGCDYHMHQVGKYEYTRSIFYRKKPLYKHCPKYMWENQVQYMFDVLLEQPIERLSHSQSILIYGIWRPAVWWSFSRLTPDDGVRKMFEVCVVDTTTLVWEALTQRGHAKCSNKTSTYIKSCEHFQMRVFCLFI